MPRWITYASAIFLALHGLVHLMGFLVYLRITEMKDLPYKTTLLGGRWEAGEAGMRVFGIIWLLPLIGFALAAYGLFADNSWWRPVLIGTTLISLALTGLDYKAAYAGAIINGVILGVTILYPLFT
ncbi:ABC transporter permease [Myxococcota bacterium]